MDTRRVWSYEALEEELRYLDGVMQRCIALGNVMKYTVECGEENGKTYWDVTVEQ